MRLQPKRVVNAELALQKKRDIDAGLALARKVDALRETAATEERNLGDFRKRTLAIVQQEIDAKIQERISLDFELERKKENIRKIVPINLKKEWEKARKDRSDNELWSERLAEKEVRLIAKEGDNAVFLERLANERKKIERQDVLSVRNLDAAEVKFEQASITLEKHKEEANKILQSAQTKEKDVITREVEVDYRERTLIEREDKVTKHEKDLSDRERALTDKYQTFVRAQSYVKK